MKPILFNTEMVRAIRNNQKTVTRRVVPERVLERYYDYDDYCNAVTPHDIPCTRFFEKDFFMDKAPYHPGDILYVREAFYRDGSRYLYRADYDADAKAFSVRTGKEVKLKWRPSIHMPREAARLFLRVTDVRVEQLQNITPEECISEGLSREPLDEVGGVFIRGMYADLWGSTIKPADRALYGWEANPWVWVIEFERISEEEANHAKK